MIQRSQIRLGQRVRVIAPGLMAGAAVLATLASGSYLPALMAHEQTAITEVQARFTIPGDAIAFEYNNTLYYQAPSDGGLWWIDPLQGPRRLAEWPGRLIHIAQATPLNGFSMVAATEEPSDPDSRLTLAYVDPATGCWGPQVEAELPRRPWPTYPMVDIGPDGRALVQLWPDEFHPDYDRAFGPASGLEPDTPALFLDARRGIAAPIDHAALIGPDARDPQEWMWVTAEGESRVWLEYRNTEGQSQFQELILDTEGRLEASTDLLLSADEARETWRMRQLVDCLVRGFYPGEIRPAAEGLRRLIEADAVRLYSEIGYSLPASGHCFALGSDLLFLGTEGTSAGPLSTLEMLPQAVPVDVDQRLEPQNEPWPIELDHDHFRPSVLTSATGDVITHSLALQDREAVVVLTSRDGYREQHRHQIPYYVGQAVLSPEGHLIVLEGRGRVLNANPERLRVTILAN